MNARHGFVCRHSGTEHDSSVVLVAQRSYAPVGCGAIGVDSRTGLHGVSNKRQQMLLGSFRNTTQADASESLWRQPFNRDGNKGLGSSALAPRYGLRCLLVTNGQVALVDFDCTLEAFSVRANHGPAETMQHRPCRFVAAQTKYPLQSERADPLLLVGQIPCGGKPNSQRRTGFVENGARANAGLMPTFTTHQPPATGSIRRACAGASRADKSQRPAQRLQVGLASFLRAKPIEEVIPGAGVVFPRNRTQFRFVHGGMLPQVELSG